MGDFDFSIFSILNQVGLSALTTFVVIIVIYRFAPGYLQSRTENIVDEREHRQKLEEWRQQKDYRFQGVLILAMLENKIDGPTMQYIARMLEIDADVKDFLSKKKSAKGDLTDV